MIEVVPLTDDLCLELAARLRIADQREMSAMTGDDTAEGCIDELRSLLRMSRGLARAALMDGRLVVAWGVATRTIIGTTGHPWMLATDDFTDRRFRLAFARRCRDEFLATVPHGVTSLWNMVDETNAVAIRWLKYLNFNFSDERADHGGIRWVCFSMEAS